jgi:hypothetical protein
VDGLCEEFFSRSTGALNQDGTIALGNVGEDMKDFVNPVVFADDISQCVPLGEFLFQFLNSGKIPEGLNPANDLAFFIP